MMVSFKVHIFWIDMTKFGAPIYFKRSIAYLKRNKLFVLKELTSQTARRATIFFLECPREMGGALEPRHVGNGL